MHGFRNEVLGVFTMKKMILSGLESGRDEHSYYIKLMSASQRK